MSILIFILIAFLLFSFPFLRIVVLNFFSWLFLSFKDIFYFFKTFQFNVCPTGKIICFSGLFGYGKTLSCVREVCRLYSRYNDKKCFIKGKWRIQKIVVLSNVNLTSIPFIEFKSLSQITEFTQKKPNLDGNNYWYVLLVLGDEFSCCLNSRQFKSNIDPIFLNSLVTARHYSISLFYTSQRFNLVDKLLRDVTFYVVECRKIGRVELNYYYDAPDLENCPNTSLVKPLRRKGFLVTDKTYSSYDTFAVVENLIKSSTSGDMLSSDEILEKLDPNVNGIEALSHRSGRLKRMDRRKH